MKDSEAAGTLRANVAEIQLVEAMDELARVHESKNLAYRERNMLVAALSKHYPSHLMRHPDADTTWEDDWRWIVCIESPAGQMTWHLHDSHLPLFSHLVEWPHHWDGHTTDEKYARLEALLKPGATP